MLKANVGLSRKITRDYNSTGYSVNIEGEIQASLDDSEAVVERIKELWSVAGEALAQEIDRDQSEDAIGRRDERSQPPASDNSNGQQPKDQPQRPPQNGNESKAKPEEQATNKQCQYLLNLAKRQNLTKAALGFKIEQILGFPVELYHLTKRQAGLVIDTLTGNGAARSQIKR